MTIAQRFVDLLLKNGKILGLLFLFLAGAGAFATTSLQRQGFPEVLINVASVQVVYPSASADLVEREVIIPLEAAVESVDSVTEYQASATDNFGILFVTFDQKSDLEKGVSELRDAVDAVRLPEDALDAEVVQFSASGSGEFILAVMGYTDAWDLYEAGLEFERELREVEGVKAVTALNELTPEIRVVFDDAKLAKAGLTRAALEQTLQGLNFSAPAGSFENDGLAYSVTVSRSVNSLAELAATQLAPGVTLGDLATITTELSNNDKYNRVGFADEDTVRVERGLLYGISVEKDADILDVEVALNEVTADFSARAAGTASEKGGTLLEANDPAYITVFSQAVSTRQQISEISQSIFGAKIESLGAFGFVGYLLGGLGLVVVLLLIFMNWRVAIMSALAIPLSLFFASIYLSLAGIDLNTLVLFSMVLVIGLVIDPTIVFLESMQRNIEKGLNGRDAMVETMRTVGLGVFLAVATNAIVFIPFGMVSGFFGEIIKYIPATVIPAMIASMLVPMLFFMPAASVLLKPRDKNKQVDPDDLNSTWRIGKWLAGAIEWMLADGFWRAGVRVLIFVLVMAVPFATGAALVGTGKVEVVQFAAQEDSDFIMVNGDLPNEWLFDKAVYETVVDVQTELAKIEEVKNFFYYTQSGNDFTILVELDPIKERAEAGGRTATEVANAFNESVKQLDITGEITAMVSSEGPPQEQNPVKVRIYDQDSQVLELAAKDIRAYLAAQEGVLSVTDNASQAASGGSAVLNLDTQNLINLSAFPAYGVIQSRLAENDLFKITFDGTQYQVVTEMGDKPQDLVDVLKTPFGPVPVGALVDSVTQLESVQIQRYNGRKYVEVSASVDADADELKIQSDLEVYLSVEKATSLGLDADALDFEGPADSIQESFTDLFIALGVAIFMIYLLLVGFFRSFFEPFIILFAIPLGLAGVFVAIALTTGQLGFLELLGVVAMAGIVVNVTILLLDYANQLHREGMTVEKAIATAVGVRLRPIALTQLTAFGGLIGLVYLSPFWEGLAASIIFGIAASGILSLIVTPILYKWLHTISKLPKRIFKR